jgi:beta-1,4-mannosyl-glycoprotein beta-1,4-N-acetylglucosaminyltransferase
MKIIDCFTFYNEIDLLTYRLNLLNDYVNYFVIVEARQTHTGRDKPLFFEENKQIYEKFTEKIIHHVVDLPYKYENENKNIRPEEAWLNENFQRNVISECLYSKINMSESDIIIISDLDEICNPNILYNIKEGSISVGINTLEMDFYYYNLNTFIPTKWRHAKIMSLKKYKESNKNFTDIRLQYYPSILSGGWHLSYFGDEHFISNKIKNFAHTEFNLPEITDLECIKKKIENQESLYNGPNEQYLKIEIKDNMNLPHEYDKYLKKYYK